TALSCYDDSCANKRALPAILRKWTGFPAFLGSSAAPLMDSSDTAKTGDSSSIRRPQKKDAAAVHGLVVESQVLDRNSLYAYLLVCTHFAATSAVAERAGEVVGFVSAYFLPDSPQTLFIWQ